MTSKQFEILRLANAKVIASIVFLLLQWVLPMAATAETSVSNVVAVAQERMSEYWDDLCELTDDGIELLKERELLPDEAWFGRDKRGQDERIAKNLVRCRELLLSDDIGDALKRLEKVNDKIAAIRKEVSKLTEEKFIRVSKEEQINKKIAKCNQEIEKLNLNKAEVVNEISRNIEANAGVRLERRQLEFLLSMRSAEDFLDNALIAGEIRKILSKLQMIMQSQKDTQASRRYCGMYLVLIDVQIQAIEDVDGKINKMWIPIIDAKMKEAEQERDKAAEGAESAAFSENERAGFARNKVANECTLRACEMYRKLLLDRSVKYRELRESLSKRRMLAQNTYDTVRIAGEVLTVFHNSENDFERLATLDIPELDMTGSIAVIEEFQKITRYMTEQETQYKDFKK